MSQEHNRQLAYNISTWFLHKTGETAEFQHLDTGVWIIRYKLNGKEQPTIRIEITGAVIIPVDTNFKLMMDFLLEDWA